MGASSDQIDRQIRETRERMDENLDALEKRATTNAARYGRIVVIVAGAAIAGAAVFIVVRRLRRPTLKQRLEGMSPEALRDLAAELGSRLKRIRKSAPSITLTVNDRDKEKPGTVESILRKVAPSVIGTASTAVIGKLTGARGEHEVNERDASYVRPALD